MACDIVDLCDAVVEKINTEFDAASYAYTAFTAVRDYSPALELKEMTDLGCMVIPGKLNTEIVTRSPRHQRKIGVDISLFQVIGQGPMTREERLAAVDPILEIAVDLNKFLLGKRIGDYICVETEQEQIYDPDEMINNRLFLCVLRATYLVVR